MFHKKFKVYRKQKISQQCKSCIHINEDCWIEDSSGKCVRYNPQDNYHLMSVEGVVGLPPEIDSNMFTQMFTNWVDSQGWFFCGITGPEEITD